MLQKNWGLNCRKMPEHVYEFINGRKVTKREFLRWFEKKFLYILRKFHMIEKGDLVIWENKKDFRGVVLEDLLEMFAEKAPIELVKDKKGKYTKKAISSSSNTEGTGIIKNIIKGKAKDMNKFAPVDGKIIKPLYLFLDKEIKLYADLKDLKYKKFKEKSSNKDEKILKFLEDMESKHPELRYSIIQSYLEISK